MIDEIAVQNLALIREATLLPSQGLTVLTGETGAGKTALLSALKLLMGARANADMVRDGEDGLVVSGRFFNGGASGEDDAAVGADRPDGDGPSREDRERELVVVRRVNAEGRSRATVNGTMASMKEIADLVAPAIDLCGQFEHQQLMRPANHLGLLDAWAGSAVADELAAYRAAFEEAGAAAAELERIATLREQSDAQLDEARFVLARIDEVNPLEGEYEQLARDLELAEHSESLASASASARAALSDDGGALDSLNAAASALESAGSVDADLAELAAALREAGFVLEDVSAQVRDYRDRIEFDPNELAFQQERFASMKGLLRTYGPTMEDVFARRARAAELVGMADDSGELLRRAQARADEAEGLLAQAADALDGARAAAAPRFAEEVTEVLGRLHMAGARLVCRQERLPREAWSAKGPSGFEFLYCPTQEAHPRPLARIASGGEVSRVMLAVKVALGNHDDVQTLVFDEVDAGVGGAVAVSLADEISRLAATHQVIVVTHLAQVAVRGDMHYIVRRNGNETELVQVGGIEREREIARMLSGSVTEASLAHARELLGNR